MLKSMTGFGKAICELEDKTLVIEAKSLNSKQLDVYLRVPNNYKEKEPEIRSVISNLLDRGKVELTITCDNSQKHMPTVINKHAVEHYYNQLIQLTDKLNIDEKEHILPSILRFPDVLITEHDELDDNEWTLIKSKIEEALQTVDSYRKEEGISLHKDIVQRIKNIEDGLQQIEPYEKSRITAQKERLQTLLNQHIDNDKIDKNRFEQELIYYLEKFDITEEKVRLKHHCEYFFSIIDEERPIGKKLGFISQEIGREINTIGSKANNSDIQRVVVLMKDELEKIKEQLMNVW